MGSAGFTPKRTADIHGDICGQAHGGYPGDLLQAMNDGLVGGGYLRRAGDLPSRDVQSNGEDVLRAPATVLHATPASFLQGVHQFALPMPQDRKEPKEKA